MTQPKSPHGGVRAGAGRKPAWDTPLCGFVVGETRRLAKEKMASKQWKLLVTWRPEYSEVAELQGALQPGTRPDPDTLADIKYHFEKATDGGLGLPRYVPGVALSPIEWGKIYSEVAAKASKRFGRTISVRQVKRCIAEWLKFERSIEVELGDLKNGAGAERS